MTGVRKKKEKKQARKLRKQGLSYSEIQERVNVSKNSISLWCRDIKLNKSQKERLKENIRKGSEKGRKITARKKKIRKKKRIKKSKDKGKKKVGAVNKRDRFVAGLMLYEGEGSKTDGRVELANTSPKVIKFMIEWFQEFFDKKPKDFKVSLYIHDNLDINKALEFWSDLTKIPKENFRDPYIVKNNEDSLKRNRHEYGVARIEFSDIDVHRQIIGSISKILS